MVVLLLAIVVAAGWNWSAIEARGLANAAVSARIACSCHYVSDRELGKCRQDIGPAARLALLSADESDTSVTAWIPLIASQSATFSEGQGCVLEPWSH